MSISYLIVTLALSNIQDDRVRQPSTFIEDRYMSRGRGEVLLVSGGNPWAMPVPDAEYPLDPRKQPPVEINRPRYITPEELESLERKPEQQRDYGSDWAPLNTDGLLKNRGYAAPAYGGTRYGYPGYYGPGVSPFYGGYGYPYPGVSPMADPYGDIPIEGFLPFMY